MGFSHLIELVKSPPRSCVLATTSSPEPNQVTSESNLAPTPSSPASRKRKGSPQTDDACPLIKQCAPGPSTSSPSPIDPPLPSDQSSCRVLPDFRSEAARLASFNQWKVSFIQPADLAKAGFFSFNSQDSCKCAFCILIVGDWVEGDEPMNEHARLMPNCPFILGGDVGNVPLDEPSASPESGNVEDHLETSLNVSSNLRICTECNQRVDSHNFARHLLSHEGKTFNCDQCGQDFKRKDFLVKHKKKSCPR